MGEPPRLNRPDPVPFPAPRPGWSAVKAWMMLREPGRVPRLSAEPTPPPEGGRGSCGVLLFGRGLAVGVIRVRWDAGAVESGDPGVRGLLGPGVGRIQCGDSCHGAADAVEGSVRAAWGAGPVRLGVTRAGLPAQPDGLPCPGVDGTLESGSAVRVRGGVQRDRGVCHGVPVGPAGWVGVWLGVPVPARPWRRGDVRVGRVGAGLHPAGAGCLGATGRPAVPPGGRSPVAAVGALVGHADRGCAHRRGGGHRLARLADLVAADESGLDRGQAISSAVGARVRSGCWP